MGVDKGLKLSVLIPETRGLSPLFFWFFGGVRLEGPDLFLLICSY